jgi:hypothetical protein
MPADGASPTAAGGGYPWRSVTVAVTVTASNRAAARAVPPDTVT